MGRLTSLPPSLPRLSSTLAWLPDDSQGKAAYRRATSPWMRLYNTARWKRLRAATLLRDLYQCQMCNRIEANTSKLVADHKRPHRGNETIFWDESNLWTLCQSCHSGAKQKQETGGQLD
jgi:5-methylcytosine-specific restriction protein A